MFESDHVSLLEAQLARVLRLEVVERLTGWLVQRGRGGAGRVAVRGGHAGVKAGAELRGRYIHDSHWSSRESSEC